MTDKIQQNREREFEVRAWYFKRTGHHIRSRAHLARVAEDYRLFKAVEAALKQEDVET
jgi:hypothetical protein